MKRTVITVLGGVAYVLEKPNDSEVFIVDWDELKERTPGEDFENTIKDFPTDIQEYIRRESC